MNLDNLKTTFAKERHGELMVATAGAMLLAVFNGLLAPETLKFLDSPEHSIGFTYRVVLWSAVIVLACLLLIKGLKKIDSERASKHESSIGVPDVNLPNSPMQNGSLNIQIKHGLTQISINVQQGENK
jgi:hypothetical protein